MHSSQFTKRAETAAAAQRAIQVIPLPGRKASCIFITLRGKADGKCNAISANERQLPSPISVSSWGPFGRFLPLNAGLSLQPCKFNLARGRRVRRKRSKKHGDMR